MARRPSVAVLLLVLLLFAPACKLGPGYKRPPVTTPGNWREVEVAESNSIANTPWWELFQDEQLKQLIQTALNENKDLQIAVERITEARALYGFTRADLYPRLDLGAATGGLGISTGSLLHTPGSGNVKETDIHVLGVDLGWELDFFGRLRRANEAQRAEMLATEEARRSVVIALVADVARAYMELRSLDLSLEVGRRTLVSRREYVELARLRFEGGVTSEVDWRQAEAELHRTEALVQDIERQIAQKENELSVLVGHNPGAIARGRRVNEQPMPAQIPAWLPSALLERRPDILTAEQQLVAANARIGEAKAMLYPQISLTGSYGYASTELDELFTTASLNILARLTQPLFNAGKNRRRVEVRESQQRQAALAYQRTILNAFREVEDSLVAHRIAGEKRESQRQRVVAQRKVLELAELRYRGGVAAYLEVLDAQRSLFNAELEEVQSINDHLVTMVRIYKALGGGWPGSPAPAQSPTSGTKKESSGGQ